MDGNSVPENILQVIALDLNKRPMSAKRTVRISKSGSQAPLLLLSDSNVLIEVHILNRVQQFNSLFHWTLKRFTAGNQAHPPGAFVDDSSDDGILQIPSAFGFPAAVDQTGATHVAIGNLVPTKVNRMVAC